MVGCNSPIDAKDAAAFEELADKITAEIHDDECFSAFGKAYHEAIIIKLLDGVINVPAIFTSHVQIFYDGFEDYLCVLVVDIPQCGIQSGACRQDRLVHFKNMLGIKYPAFKYAIYNNHIVIVMSSKNKASFEELIFDQDKEFFDQNKLIAGISKSFESPYELREHYDEAVAALKKG
jgi:hypothetical protein